VPTHKGEAFVAKTFLNFKIAKKHAFDLLRLPTDANSQGGSVCFKNCFEAINNNIWCGKNSPLCAGLAMEKGVRGMFEIDK